VSTFALTPNRPVAAPSTRVRLAAWNSEMEAVGRTEEGSTAGALGAVGVTAAGEVLVGLVPVVLVPEVDVELL
jgi:hypothetical protein